PPGGPAAVDHRARVEGTAPLAQTVSAPRVSETSADRGRRGRARTRRLSLGRDARTTRDARRDRRRGGVATDHTMLMTGRTGGQPAARLGARSWPLCGTSRSGGTRAFRMSPLRTNPILAALRGRPRNRRISVGFIVEAAAGASAVPLVSAAPSLMSHPPPRRTPAAPIAPVLDRRPVISVAEVIIAVLQFQVRVSAETVSVSVT